jgi:hypothetical protein
LCNFQKVFQSKQLPKWRKFAQSGHPAGKKNATPLAVLRSRVARWFVFKPKIQIWENFLGSYNGRCWHILWTLDPFYGLLLYLMDIW